MAPSLCHDNPQCCICRELGHSNRECHVHHYEYILACNHKTGFFIAPIHDIICSMVFTIAIVCHDNAHLYIEEVHKMVVIYKMSDIWIELIFLSGEMLATPL